MLTVSKKWLQLMAIKIEIDAKQSLPTWVLLGQANRYNEDMHKAGVLRRAAEIKNVSARREFLRANKVAT